MTTFVLMHNPGLPGDPRVEAPAQAEALYAAHGFLRVDGDTATPEPIYLTPGLGDLRYLKTGDVTDPDSPGGAALRAALVAGSVYNNDGSLNTTKKLHVKLTADGTDIDDLIIETVA